MPIPVPRSSGGRRPPRPRVAVGERSIHSRRQAEDIDSLVSLAVDVAAPIEVMDDLVTVGALLAFAAATPVQPTLLAGSITTPPSATTGGIGGSPGDASYVPGAQQDSGSNPARSDLGGLAVNTYQLKMAAAAQFQISPGSIGGRAYRPYKSDHTTGHAIDIPGSGARGQSIADWVIPQAAAYKVKYIIFNHRIWYPGRGWQTYTPSKAVLGFTGDPYHERHVHVSTY